VASRVIGQDAAVTQEKSVQQSAGRLARGMWTLLEPVHAVSYFVPEGKGAFAASGVRGFWRGYFAGRCAPLGPVGAAPVTAVFCSFSPAMTTRALPAVWELIDPATALRVRAQGAAAGLRRLLAGPGTGSGPGTDTETVADLADRLWPVVEGLDSTGRALGSANAVLPRPDDPYQSLWQAATTLREHRGDGHVAAVVAADLTGLELLVLRSAGELDRAALQPARGWTDDEWQAADRQLRERGLLAGSGPAAMTRAGWELVAQIEATTDRLAARAWSALIDTGSLGRLAVDLGPVARSCQAGLPDRNPIGLQATWDAAADPTGTRWPGPGSVNG